MGKKRLPPNRRLNQPLYGPNILGYTVGSWHRSLDGSGPAVAVGISIDLQSGEHLVLRLKTPAAVDTMIQCLLRHKRDVWPEAP